MTLWLDASVLVSLVTREPTSALVDRVLNEEIDIPVASDFCVAESSAAISRLVRIRTLSAPQAEQLFQELDIWTSNVSRRLPIEADDIQQATALVRLPGVALRAPDAIHIAAAQRVGATILTLDRGMARAADLLGVPCINPAEADAPGDLKD